MWRKLKRHACPLGGAGRFTYKKAPRAGRQALRSGGFCKSLELQNCVFPLAQIADLCFTPPFLA
jgi:hypothetical protein